MNANNINNEDLIYLFLDGEADEAERRLLFDTLSTDKSLQNSFYKAAAVNKSLHRDSEETKPPVALTADLFKQAGIGLAAAAGAGTIAAISADRSGGLLKYIKDFFTTKLFTAGISSLLSIVATYTVLTNLDDNQISVPPAAAPLVEIVEVIKEVPAETIETTKAPEPINSHIATAAPADAIVDKEDNIQEAARIVYIPAIQPSFMVKPISAMIPVAPDLSGISVAQAQNLNTEEEPLGLLISANGIYNAFYLPKLHSNIAEPYALNNMQFKVGYEFWDRIYLGLQYNCESFPLYVDGSPDYYYMRKGRESMISIGAFGEYLFDEIRNYNIFPYTDGFLGLASYGPVGKFTAGCQWRPAEIISVHMGLDATYLLAGLGGGSSWKLFSKYGIVYGVTVGL